MNHKKTLIFGTFDGIHDGHLYFINEAKKQGDQLIAVVARDLVVEKLKGKCPDSNEVDRINKLLEVPEIDLVLLGDLETGTYNVLREVNPDIIFLGYDQDKLKDDLSKKIKKGYLKKMEILQCGDYQGDKFHSSILNNKNA